MDKEPLFPVTVRFRERSWNVIRDISEEMEVSQAEVVRTTVAGNMARYLGDVRYIDQAQAKEIKQLVVELPDAVSTVRNELHRIGVNINQEAEAANVAAKHGGYAGSSRTAMPVAEMTGSWIYTTRRRNGSARSCIGSSGEGLIYRPMRDGDGRK